MNLACVQVVAMLNRVCCQGLLCWDMSTTFETSALFTLTAESVRLSLSLLVAFVSGHSSRSIPSSLACPTHAMFQQKFQHHSSKGCVT